MTAVRSYLARFMPVDAASPETLEALRARAWAEQGVVVLHVDELGDDWLRQGLVNEATRRWGRRMKGVKR